jgi:hypothetical protein
MANPDWLPEESYYSRCEELGLSREAASNHKDDLEDFGLVKTRPSPRSDFRYEARISQRQTGYTPSRTVQTYLTIISKAMLMDMPFIEQGAAFLEEIRHDRKQVPLLVERSFR